MKIKNLFIKEVAGINIAIGIERKKSDRRQDLHKATLHCYYSVIQFFALAQVELNSKKQQKQINEVSNILSGRYQPIPNS